MIIGESETLENDFVGRRKRKSAESTVENSVAKNVFVQKKVKIFEAADFYILISLNN